MGFFQDLKEDLSMAVNELIPDLDDDLDDDLEEPEETDGNVEATEKGEAVENSSDEAVVVNEDIFRAAVERLDENADVFAKTEDTAADATVTGPEEKQEAETEELAEEAEPAEEAVEEEPAEEPETAEEANETAEEQPEPSAETAEAAEDTKEQEEEDVMMADALIREVCDEIENGAEETELEKEVGRIMTQQKETVLAGEVLDETAVITNGMKVTGDVSSQGSMDVLGIVKGNIEILGKLNISGEVEGNSTASEVYADSAKITGEIHADGSVKVGQSSVIIGNIFATSAVIAGAVKGDIDVQGPVILDASAIVMGNIKSKSVQINNGAVIEGMCSQCYADVNPAAFFQDLNK
jgi:cytoskeletal protein CcmA (bactofilin family)